MSLRRIPELLMIPAFAALALAGSAHAAAPPHDYKITPVPLVNVRFTDTFWSPRMETNREVTVWYDFQKCEETGRIDNFAKAGGLMQGEFRGISFDDSDVLQGHRRRRLHAWPCHPDPKLDNYLDDLIAKIAAARSPTATSTPRGRCGPTRCLPSSARSAGRTWRPATSCTTWATCTRRRWRTSRPPASARCSDVALKNADLLVPGVRPAASRAIVPGHQEIEIGLVKLYRVTGDEKYLKLAKFFLDTARPGGDAEALRRVLPGPPAGGRADRGGRPRGARGLPVRGHGRRGRADRRRGACGGHRPHLGGRRSRRSST